MPRHLTTEYTIQRFQSPVLRHPASQSLFHLPARAVHQQDASLPCTHSLVSPFIPTRSGRRCPELFSHPGKGGFGCPISPYPFCSEMSIYSVPPQPLHLSHQILFGLGSEYALSLTSDFHCFVEDIPTQQPFIPFCPFQEQLSRCASQPLSPSSPSALPQVSWQFLRAFGTK